MLWFFFHPHLHIKSKASAYMSRHLHIKSKTSAYTIGTCFRFYMQMPLDIQALVLDFIRKCGWKKKHLPIECLQGTIIIYSVVIFSSIFQIMPPTCLTAYPQARLIKHLYFLNLVPFHNLALLTVTMPYFTTYILKKSNQCNHS